VRPDRSAPPLTNEEFASALSKSASASAPGPYGIPYLTLKRVNSINASILLQVHSPPISLGYHPASPKVANGVFLEKPGKLSYESPSYFRIIVLIHTGSKILERIVAAGLHLAAHRKGLIHQNQFPSLPGLSTYDSCLTLMNDMKTLERRRLKVSSLFLDMKAGFDNVDNPMLAGVLREGGIPPNLVSWVASFVGKRSYPLVFQGMPGTPAPIHVVAPRGSRISPLLFLIYIAPLHWRIPPGVFLSYIDDMALTITSLSYRGNICRLHGLFKTIKPTQFL